MSLLFKLPTKTLGPDVFGASSLLGNVNMNG